MLIPQKMTYAYNGAPKDCGLSDAFYETLFGLSGALQLIYFYTLRAVGSPIYAEPAILGCAICFSVRLL